MNERKLRQDIDALKKVAGALMIKGHELMSVSGAIREIADRMLSQLPPPPKKIWKPPPMEEE